MLGYRIPRIPNILRSQLSEEERQHERRKGEDLAIEADMQRRPDESLAQAIERLRQSRRS